MNFRVIADTATGLKDFSHVMADYFAGEMPSELTSAQYIYIGSKFAFNSFYLNVSSVNTNTSIMNLCLWDGNAFEPVADFFDGTNLAGATLGQSGHIVFTPDKDGDWVYQDTSTIPVLSGFNLYNFYWARIGFSDDLETDTSLSWIGHLFSNDNSLRALGYADLCRTSVLTAYETGKTTWQDQHVAAAKVCIQALISNNQIASANQLLNSQDLEHAATHKCAEIIYSSFGDDYKDQREAAAKEFDKAIAKAYPIIDQDGNAIEDDEESYPKWNSGSLIRQ